jgi:hypothetical protein
MRICAAIRQLTRQLIRPILHLQPIPLSAIPLLVIPGSRDWKAILALLGSQECKAIPALGLVPLKDLAVWDLVLLALLPVILALKEAPLQGLAAWDLVIPVKVRAHLQDLMGWAKTVLMALGPALALMVLAAVLMALVLMALVVPGPAEVLAATVPVLAAELMVAMAAAVVVTVVAATVADDGWLLDL